MIISHPFLFNSIVVLFIAFTSGWLVFGITGKTIRQLKNRVQELEKEKEASRKQILASGEQAAEYFTYPLNGTPVITLPPSVKVGNS